MKVFGILLSFSFAVCLSVAIASGQAVAPAAPSGTPSGADLFQHRCAGCHGADGAAHTRAGASFHALDYHDPLVLKMSDADLTAIIHDGKNRMPAFGNRLSQADIASVVAYIHTLQKQ